MNIAAYLNQDISYKPKTGTDGFGKPIYGSVQTVPARFEDKQQLVRNAQGQEVMSSAEVLMIVQPNVGDQINGRTVMNRGSIVAKDGTVLGYQAYL